MYRSLTCVISILILCAGEFGAPAPIIANAQQPLRQASGIATTDNSLTPNDYSQVGIQPDMVHELTSGTGLITRWSMRDGPVAAHNSSITSDSDGNLANSLSSAAGPPFEITKPVPPPAPSNLSASLAPGSQVDLSWTDNSSNETGFTLEVAPGPSCSSWTPLANLTANVVTYRHWNTLASSQYCYRVRAFNAQGSSAWANSAIVSTPVSYQALSLGRDSSYVRFADDGQLHLQRFTIETWFRREGPGITYTTGSGGIVQALPLIGKGASVEDGTAQDSNYFLAIDNATSVIGADFEECNPATQGPDCALGGTAGLNHPILGVTPLSLNTWYHAAVTFDGTTLRLYLDGNLENTLLVNHLPRWDNASPLGLGTSMINSGTPQGFFDGSLDEVRIWSYARSQEQIKSTINTQISTPTSGLVARWALDEASGTSITGSAGTSMSGSIYPLSPAATGWNWTAGAPFNIPFSPEAPVLVLPTDGAAGVPASEVNLQVSVSYFDSESLTVSYYGREFCPTSSFTLVALPDTQYYSQDYPSIFTSQTNWIVNHRTERNIAFVTHMGDVVYDASVVGQWTNADAAYDILDVFPPIPYGLLVGNHDSYPMGAPANTAAFNTYFGIDRFAGQPFYGGHYGLDNDNSYYVFTAGGMNFIVIHLEYNASPDPAVLAWADGLLNEDPDRRGIVVNHSLVTTSGTLSAEGQAIYDALKHNPNLFLMLAGHIHTEISFTLTDSGHTIYIVQADFQARPSGGNGLLRLMEFQPNADQIQVYTYSPYLDQFETDADSQFTLPYTMTGANCSPFELIQALADVPRGSSPSIDWPGRGDSVKYEWYVTVSDGTHTVTGPTWSFTTAAPTAVSLLDFAASSTPAAIQLTWRTAHEIDLLGFNLYRAESIDGPRAMLNAALIPALNPGQLSGDSYQFVDLSAEPGKTYYYWVEWVGSDSTELLGPAPSYQAHAIWLPVGLK